MKFLIDECLSVLLPAVAWQRGYEAHHVTRKGFGSWLDPALMDPIREESFTFVTHNGKDFRRLFGMEAVHVGLVIFLPERPLRDQQVALFEAVIDHIEQIGDPFNQLIEVDFDGDDVVVRRLDWAADDL